MPKFTVLIREVHINHVEVDDAKDIDDAIKQAGNREGDEITLEYSHTLDWECWQVEDEDGNIVKE